MRGRVRGWKNDAGWLDPPQEDGLHFGRNNGLLQATPSTLRTSSVVVNNMGQIVQRQNDTNALHGTGIRRKSSLDGVPHLERVVCQEGAGPSELPVRSDTPRGAGQGKKEKENSSTVHVRERCVSPFVIGKHETQKG